MISSTAEPNRMLILRASELLSHRTRDMLVVYSKGDGTLSLQELTFQTMQTGRS